MALTGTGGRAPAEAGTACVLGAGIAGMYAARRLVDAGYAVTIVERSAICGGAHRSCKIGAYTFDVGSIFYEPRALLFDLAPLARAACPQVLRKQRRISHDGKLLHYPIEPRDLLRQSVWRSALGGADMATSRLLVQRDGSLDAIARRRLGSTFYKGTGLRSYITRFHHLDPALIDEDFFFHRMGFIEKSTRFSHIARAAWQALLPSWEAKREGARRPLHVRPQEGFGALFEPLRQSLERDGVRFEFESTLEAIIPADVSERGFAIVTSRGRQQFDCVVSTIPIESTYQALFGETSGLVSLDMTTLFVSAGKLSPATGNVLFNFDAAGLWKRATVYSRIYGMAPDEREYFAVEVTIPRGGKHDPAASFADFAAHMTARGLASDLRLEGESFSDAVYPLYLKGSNKLIVERLARVRATNVILAGRQGLFEYLPTSTGVIRQVGKVLDSHDIACQGAIDAIPDSPAQQASS